MKRTRLKRVGARVLREADARAKFRARPPVKCERCQKRGRVVAHHIQPRSRGGPHTPENRFWLCEPCHDAIHDHQVSDWNKWIISTGPNNNERL